MIFRIIMADYAKILCLCICGIVIFNLSITSAVDDVCYPPVGCFNMSAPWRSTLRPLPPPATPDVINTRVYLYTRGQRDSCDVTTTVDGSDFKGEKRTFFITHGFLGNGFKSWIVELKDTLLENYDSNVFVVDWSQGARNASYLQVAANTRLVGAELARLGRYLISSKRADPKRFHLLGHSLGAHVLSYMAKGVPNIGRITAFDPAHPAFDNYPREVRLDSSDAIFVDVIHTSNLGMTSSVGHADFYMNGGRDQPGCIHSGKSKTKSTSLSEYAKLPLNAISGIVRCEHARAHVYFTESLRNKYCSFWGWKVKSLTLAASVLSGGRLSRYFADLDGCTQDTCLPLGMEAVNYPARGNFLIATSRNSPFCISGPKIDARMLEFHYFEKTL